MGSNQFGIGQKGSMKGTGAALALRAAADRLDSKRRDQIARQIAIINRLLKDPDAAAEIARLSEALAEAVQTIKDLREKYESHKEKHND